MLLRQPGYRGCGYEFFRQADAEFIAHAPEDIRYLLDRVRVLSAEREAMACDGGSDAP